MYLLGCDQNETGMRQIEKFIVVTTRGRDMRFLLFVFPAMYTRVRFHNSSSSLHLRVRHSYSRTQFSILSKQKMEIAASNLKNLSHARSVSLPTSSHPLLLSAEEHLQRLKSAEGASSSPHASACRKLDDLKNLYEYLDDVLQLPLSQQVLPQWEEEVLERSLRLVDICGAVREIYSQIRESVQTLESSLRRKRSGDLSSEVGSYMMSKKQSNKMICKCYKELKKAEKNCSLEVVKKESDTVPLVNLIKEVQEVSLTVLESTLSFISQSKAERGSQPRGWSLVSKFIQHKGTSSCEGDSDIAKIEVELHLLNNKKSNKSSDIPDMQNVLKRLEAFELGIQESAEVLEIVFRVLLKTRVSLLHILNN